MTKVAVRGGVNKGACTASCRYEGDGTWVHERRVETVSMR